LMKQLLRGTSTQWEQPQKRLMMRGWVVKFSRATTDLPALSTERFAGAHAKAVTIFLLVVLQPLQRLSLGAGDAAGAFKRRDDQHIRFHFRDHGYFPSLTNLTFGLAVNVTQISNHNVGTPPKTTPTIVNARLEQITLRDISGREPTDDWNQTNRP